MIILFNSTVKFVDCFIRYIIYVELDLRHIIYSASFHSQEGLQYSPPSTEL